MVMATKPDRARSDQTHVRINGRLAWALKRLHLLPYNGPTKTALRKQGIDCNRCTVARSVIDAAKVEALIREIDSAIASKN